MFRVILGTGHGAEQDHCILGHRSDFILASERLGAVGSTMKCSKGTCGNEVENGDPAQIKSNGA